MKRKEWLSEPDLVEFQYKDYQALIIRHPDFGHLCGFVVVPEGHPLHGSNDYIQDMKHLDVHGGITYGKFQELDLLEGNKKYKGTYLIGFDCAHTWDIQPYFDKRQALKDILDEYKKEIYDLLSKTEALTGIKTDDLYDQETYKNIDFVTAELKSLIDQLVEGNNER